jgi:hypothetical protein
VITAWWASLSNELHFNGVASMAEEFDTSWFDLNNYEVAEKFDIGDWYLQLNKRQLILFF